jgi:hypothetical protein
MVEKPLDYWNVWSDKLSKLLSLKTTGMQLEILSTNFQKEYKLKLKS